MITSCVHVVSVLPSKGGETRRKACKMLEKHYIQRKDNTDLNVYRCGVESCTPGFAWGPGVRDHYLVHVIREGCGTFTLDGRTWPLCAGDGFVLPPDVLASWQADAADPYSPTSWTMGRILEQAIPSLPEIPQVPAKVPGSVQQALLTAGIIPDWNKKLDSRAWCSSTELRSELLPMVMYPMRLIWVM